MPQIINGAYIIRGPSSLGTAGCNKWITCMSVTGAGARGLPEQVIIKPVCFKIAQNIWQIVKTIALSWTQVQGRRHGSTEMFAVGLTFLCLKHSGMGQFDGYMLQIY
jgi:hypothetical protein